MGSGCVRVDWTKRKSPKKSWRVWAGFSAADARPGFLNFFYFGCDNNESCAAVTYVTRAPQIRSLFCCRLSQHGTRERPERAPQIPASALARGRSSAACRLLSAVARTQRAVGRPAARGPRGSHLAPADPDLGEKLRAALLCWLMLFFSLPTLGAKKTPCGPWRRRGMAALWKRYGSARSVLRQFYVSFMSVLYM